MTALLMMISSSTVRPPGGVVKYWLIAASWTSRLISISCRSVSGRQGSGFALNLPDDLAECRHIRPSFLSAVLLTLKRQT